MSERASDEFSLRCLFSRRRLSGYFIIVAISRLQSGVCACVHPRRRDFRDRDGKKDSRDGLRVSD